jgi:hypothetical protein
MHAHEGLCEDLARQNTVAHLFPAKVWRCRIWVSAICSVLKTTI